MGPRGNVRPQAVVDADDMAAADQAKSINSAWARLIPSTFTPVVSGFTVTFAEDWITNIVVDD